MRSAAATASSTVLAHDRFSDRDAVRGQNVLRLVLSQDRATLGPDCIDDRLCRGAITVALLVDGQRGVS